MCFQVRARENERDLLATLELEEAEDPSKKTKAKKHKRKEKVSGCTLSCPSEASV
jgi:hypothetical protein